MTKQRAMVILGAVVLTAIGIGIWAVRRPSSVEGPVERITIGAYAGDTASLVWIAEDQGFFVQNRLGVHIRGYEAGKLAADALLAGEVDITTSAEFVFVSNAFNHDDLRVLATVATADSNELIARADRGIQQPSDLKGKRIGVTRKSTGEFFLGSFLIFNGLSINEVEIVDLNPSEIVTAIVNAEIDAALTWDPNVYAIKRELGEAAVSWPGQSGQDFYFVLIGKQAWIRAHPAAVERFLRALVQAEEYVRQNNERAREFVGVRFDYEKAYIDYSWQRHDFVVTLPQALLIAMEDEARWRIKNELTRKTKVPNYLDFIYLDGLEAIRPEAVTIVR